ncbi:hypothetical protein BMT55_15765 [Listeria newyorkensis]|uniref:C1q domain-containing protein n=1 Tax=Listeria newyorkensis TaxID=1497681 RepID=A0ABX4XHY7_9LIST|nr:hypothetical protein [Listeria newyorkensis]PNP88217.1 hypothetical protein BMT55_15765 [Listeria newyorkensis]
MAEKYFFFNSHGNDKREYHAEDFAALIQEVTGSNLDVLKIGTGVGRFRGGALTVSANGSNMMTTVSDGSAFIDGRLYINDAALQLTHEPAHPTLDRIDRVVIRLNTDVEERSIKAFVKQGTAAAVPVAPAIQDDTNIQEISIAQVKIVKGRSYIAVADVIDERSNQEVCGYLPIHNIYRGISVTENGIFSVTNSPYLEFRNTTAWILDKTRDNWQDVKLGTPVVNRNSIYSNGYIEVQEAGLYLFNFYIVLKYTDLAPPHIVYLKIYINDVAPSDTDYKIGIADINVNHMQGSNFIMLNKGDRVKLKMMGYDFAKNVSVDQTRLKFTKVQ